MDTHLSSGGWDPSGFPTHFFSIAKAKIGLIVHTLKHAVSGCLMPEDTASVRSQ